MKASTRPAPIMARAETIQAQRLALMELMAASAVRHDVDAALDSQVPVVLAAQPDLHGTGQLVGVQAEAEDDVVVVVARDVVRNAPLRSAADDPQRFAQGV